MSRSYVPITEADLCNLAKLAAEDRRDLFARKPDTGRLYADRLFAVALCQGAALHFIDGTNGVNDLYLRAGATSSAQCLAEKAVILLEPAPLLGTVVWSPTFRRSA